MEAIHEKVVDTLNPPERQSSHVRGKSAATYTGAQTMGRPSTFAGNWAKLRDTFGDIETMALYFGVTRQAVQKWANQGIMPSQATQAFIRRTALERGIGDPLPETLARAAELYAERAQKLKERGQ